MPGLAVAQEMASRGWEVSWLGTETGMEKMLVSKRGIPFDAVDFSGVRGHGAAGAASGVVKLLRRRRLYILGKLPRKFLNKSISIHF